MTPAADGGECPVCLEEPLRAVWCYMPCAHRMCFPCLLRMWEHSRRSCPLCRHDIHDCLPVPRIKVRQMLLGDGAPSEGEVLESMARRIQVVDSALRTQAIAPRNAIPLRRPPSLRIAVPASPESEAVDAPSPSRRRRLP